MNVNKTNKFKNKFKEEITQNYNICKKLLEDTTTITCPIKYQQLIYLILNGRIAINKIAYFKCKKYTKQQPLMRKSFIIQDAVKINQQIVEVIWKYQKIGKANIKRKVTMDQDINVKDKTISEFETIETQRKQITEKLNYEQESQNKVVKQQSNKFKQAKFRKQENNSQNFERQHKYLNRQVYYPQVNKSNNHKTQRPQKKLSSIQQKHSRSLTTKNLQKTKIKEKIIELSQLLSIIQSKINTSKTQIQAAQNQKQNKILTQISALKNRKRIQKQNKLLQKIQIENSSNIPQNIEKILNKMKQIKVSNAKKLNKSPGYSQKLSKFQQIERINSIFKFYTIKQITNSNRYFSNMQKQQSKLNLQTFIKFVKQFELNRIISMQQISHIFKTRSKGESLY